MPFQKVGDNDYVGPSGHHFNLNQVRLYYANGSKFPGQKKKESTDHQNAKQHFACGGPVNSNNYGK